MTTNEHMADDGSSAETPHQSDRNFYEDVGKWTPVAIEIVDSLYKSIAIVVLLSVILYAADRSQSWDLGFAAVILGGCLFVYSVVVPMRIASLIWQHHKKMRRSMLIASVIFALIATNFEVGLSQEGIEIARNLIDATHPK